MGLLAIGTPLEWPEAKKRANHVRAWGIEQLLAVWSRAKGKERDAFLWGDEIEYLVVCFDDEAKKVRLSLGASDVLAALVADRNRLKQGSGVIHLTRGQPINNDIVPVFHPEMARFMLEATPGKPWGSGIEEFLDVELSMKLRRKLAKEYMMSTEYPITLTTFPRLGSENCTEPAYPLSGPQLRSQFLPDEVLSRHIRFPTAAMNIRARRGRKIEINVPIFRDIMTPWPFRDPTVAYDLRLWPEDDDVRNGAAKENHIYMDTGAFGSGSCCLQITMQAKDIDEGRMMYDQLLPLGPIMLALTAATPIYKGFLADTDVRWNQIGLSLDDRTREELGEEDLLNDRWRIPKSRCASNSTYISNDPRLRSEYLDPNLIVDEDIKQRLVDGGMDSLLATHFAHLFIRDPIIVFAEDLEELDLSKSNHFENIQSTNWQHVRFKPPPSESDIGWRVEFRPIEIQMTDFENAALSIFIVLITRTILSFDLNFYIPIQRVTENMETAHRRDAVLNDKFWFRKNPFNPPHKQSSSKVKGSSPPAFRSKSIFRPMSKPHTLPLGPVEDEYELMTVNEIINGQYDDQCSTGFPGLIPLVESYLDSLNVDVEMQSKLTRYLDLIRKRADGRLWTSAKWIRDFVRKHPDYNFDSVVSDTVQYDLVKAAEQITRTEGKDGLGIEMLGRR